MHSIYSVAYCLFTPAGLLILKKRGHPLPVDWDASTLYLMESLSCINTDYPA